MIWLGIVVLFCVAHHEEMLVRCRLQGASYLNGYDTVIKGLANLHAHTGVYKLKPNEITSIQLQTDKVTVVKLPSK